MIFGENVRRVLVTGGAGFIGSYLCEALLKDNVEVTVVDNFSHSSSKFESLSKDVRMVTLDLQTNRIPHDVMTGQHLVVHLAANTDMKVGYQNPEIDLNNIFVTSNLLESMRHADVHDLIFSSSGAVYGNDCRDKYLAESHGPLKPAGTYAAAKIAAEMLIAAYCNLYSLRGYIFRFGNLVGGHMTHGVILDFIRKFQADPTQLEILGDGLQEKHYFLVEDCIDGLGFVFRNALLSAGDSRIFNLAPNDTTNVQQIAKIAAEELGIDPVITITGAKLGWPGDQPRVHLDVGSIARMGWVARHSSDEAVREAVRRLKAS